MVVNEYDLYEEFEVEKGPGYVGRLTAYLLDNSYRINLPYFICYFSRNIF